MEMESDNILPSIEAQREAIKRQIEELQKQSFELLQKEQEEKRKQYEESERNKYINIIIDKFDGTIIGFHKNDKRRDVTEVLTTISGHIYKDDNTHRIPLISFGDLIEKTKNLPNFSLSYANETVKEAIIAATNAASYEISLKGDKFLIKYGPRSDSWILRNIPGYILPGYKTPASVPKTEGWRLLETLASIEGVVWSDEAALEVENQTKQRADIDKIALAESWPEISEALEGRLNGQRLRPFQEVGVKFIEAVNGRALMVYDVGLGKTPMSVAYALYKNKKKVLIVCPAQLTINWSKQVEKFTGQVPHVLTGTKPNKFDVAEMLLGTKQFYIANFAVINRMDKGTHIVKDEDGYEHHEEIERWPWVDYINIAKFDLMIIDEAHYIKDADSARSIATRKIITPEVIELTATPVMNKPGEMWPLLKIAAPNLFPSQEQFIRDYTIDGKHVRNMEQYRTLLKTIMIRRRKSEVQKDLPPINRITEYHTLTDNAQTQYQKALQGVYEAINRAGEKWETDIPNILVQIMRLKQICAADKIERITDLATELYDGSEGDSHRKVLIFSQFAENPPMIYNMWRRLQPESLMFTGDTAMNTRMGIVDQFQKDDSKHYLVVSSKAASEGLDITAAGHVIFADLMWTPMAHHQAEGRAYGRESDPHSINSYYVIANGTIEDWISQLLQAKLEMFGAMVEGVDSARMTESVVSDLIKKIRESMWRK